jgi:hypothetical protein
MTKFLGAALAHLQIPTDRPVLVRGPDQSQRSKTTKQGNEVKRKDLRKTTLLRGVKGFEQNGYA